MSHEKLKALIEQARREDKIIYCPGNNNYYAVEEIKEYNRQGKLLWAVEHFQLRTYDDYCNSQMEQKKEQVKEKKGILYFPVAECGTVRVFSEDISFWYYEKKSLQTMIHLKSGDCLRVEQDIETVDIKISESKVPAIGNELAKFWEELLIDTYNNKNLQKNESDARNGN